MKLACLAIVLAGVLANDPLRISKINKAKSQAREAYTSGNYKGAIEKYRYLIDSLDVNEDEVLLNLANAYFLEKDTANAMPVFQGLTASVNNEISSKANLQLGVMANQTGKAEEALDYFKKAIKSDASNEEARYNYEMVKRKLDERNKQNQKDKKDDKNQNKDKNPEPSEFAKKLKAQADKMVAAKQYSDAYGLMMNGLKQDKTVAAYNDYIKRIKDIIDINGK
jgi:tetratricopeptide (TPR) repeat protein